MKYSALVFQLILVFFISSCATQKQTASNDDVYADPKADRIEEARIAAEKKAARDAREKRYNDSIASVRKAQREKDDANPYYKDREFKYDDYYDYEYATRIKRFDNSINGLGYYDNYYTNSYWYNGNPYNYGVSVYNGYSWWGSGYNYYSYNPSVSFYMNYGWGNNYGWGGYNGYNPYDPYSAAYWQGYNNGYYNGYHNGWGGYPYYGFSYGYGYGYGYNPYGGYSPYGYNPYYGGYGYSYPYNGWGYYNGYDSNSSYTYGPRASHTGNNSPRSSNPGMKPEDGYVQKYMTTVVTQQASIPKFAEQPIRSNPVRTGLYNSGSTPVRGQESGEVNPGKTGSYSGQPVRNTNSQNPSRTYDNPGNTPVRQQSGEPTRNGDNQPVRTYESQPVRNYNNQPVKQQQDAPKYEQHQPVRQYEQPVKQQYEAPKYEQPVRQYEAPSRDIYQTPSSPSNSNGGGGVRSGGGGRPR